MKLTLCVLLRSIFEVLSEVKRAIVQQDAARVVIILHGRVKLHHHQELNPCSRCAVNNNYEFNLKLDVVDQYANVLLPHLICEDQVNDQKPTFCHNKPKNLSDYRH